MVGSVATPLLVLLDTALVGRLPGSHQLGAVAVGTTIFNYVYWAFSFLRMSTTGLVAQARGAGDTGEVRASLARSAIVAAAIGFGLVVMEGPLVGRLPGSHQLGAVAVGTTIFNYVYWAFSFLRMSTTGLVAQARGAGDTGEVRASLARSAIVAAAIGFGLVVMEGPLVELAFRW